MQAENAAQAVMTRRALLVAGGLTLLSACSPPAAKPPAAKPPAAKIANHTWSHLDLARLPLSSITDQINRATAEIHAVTGNVPAMFRAPYGAWSPAVLQHCAQAGMTPLDWSVDPRDWARPGVTSIVSNIMRNTRTGSIILEHDGGGNRSQTVAALTQVLPRLLAAGYQFRTPLTPSSRRAAAIWFHIPVPSILFGALPGISGENPGFGEEKVYGNPPDPPRNPNLPQYSDRFLPVCGERRHVRGFGTRRVSISRANAYLAQRRRPSRVGRERPGTRQPLHSPGVRAVAQFG